MRGYTSYQHTYTHAPKCCQLQTQDLSNVGLVSGPFTIDTTASRLLTIDPRSFSKSVHTWQFNTYVYSLANQPPL